MKPPFDRTGNKYQHLPLINKLVRDTDIMPYTICSWVAEVFC
jgi:hypothetical protein